MDVLLLAITAGSLLVAFIMSAAAWRLGRLERARSAARVEALRAAADGGTAPAAAAGAFESEPVERPVFKAANLPAERCEPMAIHETRSGSLWAPARVSAFRVESIERPDQEQDWPLERPLDRRLDHAADRRADHSHARSARSADDIGDGFLKSGLAQAPSGGRQRTLAIAACVLFIAVVSGGYWTVFVDSAGAAAAARPATAAALELVSLSHERRGTALTIKGLVRNPAAGALVDQLAAVVFLFDQQGNFVTSGRADADFKKLSPGDESPFLVTLSAAANVARYRVSFRNEAGVVPHIDRRGQEPIAKEWP
jgi:hypothetical protein